MMWKKTKKRKNKKKIFGSFLNFGSKLTTSLLVVSCLGLSPLLALPWRSVNRLNLTMDTNSTKTSQEISMQNSSEVKKNQEKGLEQAKTVLKDVDESLTSTLIQLANTSEELEHQKQLVKILEADNSRTSETLDKLNKENSDLVLENTKLEQEAYGIKLLTKITGTYNRLDGFGIGGGIGLRFGKGLLFEGGATVPLSIMANPPELMNYKNYTFQTSIGWEW